MSLLLNISAASLEQLKICTWKSHCCGF